MLRPDAGDAKYLCEVWTEERGGLPDGSAFRVGFGF
jgi:hypothetical protein